MWYNYLIIAFELLKFSDFLRGCLKILLLEKQESLKDFIIEKFMLIVEEEFKTKSEKK